MIKILINNEEVVCNSNIQINEEMLSTSSTILKNCYPKSWEDDKDYISRYYFPKDYSKCKIINEENIDFEIVGSTTQDGTPTPQNPVPIISKTGVITEIIGGKQYTFDLGNIELNKIGDYQDRIYKDNGKWYVEKNIEKIDMSTITSWGKSSNGRFIEQIFKMLIMLKLVNYTQIYLVMKLLHGVVIIKLVLHHKELYG
jgi:hypothetical protein